MDLANCYRLLGLTYGASLAEVKTSYRRLARRYHPDVNAGDTLTQEKFIQLTEAYKLLLSVINEPVGSAAVSSASQTVATRSAPQEAGGTPRSPSAEKVTRKPPVVHYTPPLSEIDKQLKWNAYEQLQQLLKCRRFARAIALVEGLAHRIPLDPEVRQWQAIAYISWGRHLTHEGQLDKARIYLKKALKTDPHNRSLWAEIEKDFQRIEEML